MILKVFPKPEQKEFNVVIMMSEHILRGMSMIVYFILEGY